MVGVDGKFELEEKRMGVFKQNKIRNQEVM